MINAYDRRATLAIDFSADRLMVPIPTRDRRESFRAMSMSPNLIISGSEDEDDSSSVSTPSQYSQSIAYKVSEYFPDIDGTRKSSDLDIDKFEGPWDDEKYKKMPTDWRTKLRKIKDLHADYWAKLLPLNDKIVGHDKKHHKTRRPRFEATFLKKQRQEMFEKLQSCLRVYAFKISSRMANFTKKYKREFSNKGSSVRRNSIYSSSSRRPDGMSRQSSFRFKDESVQQIKAEDKKMLLGYQKSYTTIKPSHIRINSDLEPAKKPLKAPTPLKSRV